MKQLFKLCCLLLLTHFSFQLGFSQSTSWKGTTSVNWNLAANWTNGIPDNTKDVIIGDASFTGINQPKVNVAGSCRSVTVGGVRASTLTMTKALTLSGSVLINANGTFLHPAATLYLAGNFTNNGVYSSTATTSRILFNGVSQTVGGSVVTVFRQLNIAATSTLSLANNIIATGASSYIYVYGVLEPGQTPTYSVTSTVVTKIYDRGRLKVNSANFASNYILSGATTLYSGSVVDYASTTVNQVVSSVYSYSTLALSGTGTKSLAANLPLLYGKNAANGKILVNTGVTFNLGTFTANRATNAAGGELNIAAGAILKIGGPSNFPLNYLTRIFDITSTVEYNGIDQTVSVQNYGNLLFSSAGIKTATIACTIRGDFTISNGTFNTNATVVTHSIGGNFVMSGGSLTAANCTFNLNGTTNQAVSLLSGISKLNINKAAGDVNLGSDITVNTTLSFTKGKIVTGSYNVIIPAVATVTGASQTTGWVEGNLQKNIPVGSAVFKVFEVGATNYSPANVLFASVSVAGVLTARTGSTDQPEIDYSGLDPAKSVNRYWSLTNSGIAFTNATAIFNWNSGDIDAGATTANFRSGLFNGSIWALATTSSPLPTSIQVTGLTTMGDFSIGEIITKSTWTGAALTSDWFTPKNWLGLIPSTTNPTLIPNGIAGGRVYPVITPGTAIVNDITVESAASVTVSSILKIAGTLTSVNNVDAGGGTIEFNGSSLQLIPANSFAGNLIKNLSVSNNLTLADVTIITGTLSVANGQTLSTGDALVLKSDANGTARIASLPVDGSGNATAFINGKVSIERYIPARKAWRLLSAPIQPSTTTIDDAWQEGAYAGSSFGPNPNPNPGYGVHICGGTAANGFDESLTNSATVKIFNNSNNSFIALPPTPGTFAPINSYTGYLVYIRGDRGIDLSQGNNAATTPTTLRMKGSVKTGNQTAIINTTNLTVLANPYASAIDFSTLTRNNVKNSFYVWDPKLTGSYGLGGYVTVSWNSTTSSYDVTTSASPVSQYIPSGEAIIVQSEDGVNPGSVTVKESDKTTNGTDFEFGRPVTTAQKLRVNLYSQDASGVSSLLDGALATYANTNSNAIDADDIKKLAGAGENIGFQNEGQVFAIERRKTITESDISVLNIAKMKQRDYKLEIVAEHLDRPGFTAVLRDNYSVELNNTILNTNGSTEVLFTITDNPASYAADRFSIAFLKTKTATVFAFKAVKANVQDKNISVEWQTANESGISNYELQGSADGRNFTRLATLGSKNGISSSYSWLDVNASSGDHYYRITSIAMNGNMNHSMTAKASITANTTQDSKQLVVYPNPVRNNASLQMEYLESGTYNMLIRNINGQIIKRLSIVHNGGMFRYSFLLDSNLPSGKYSVTLTDAAAINHTTSMIKE